AEGRQLVLEGLDFLSENVVLGRAHALDGREDLVADGSVLSAEIEQRDRSRPSRGLRTGYGLGSGRLSHGRKILAGCVTAASHKQSAHIHAPPNAGCPFGKPRADSRERQDAYQNPGAKSGASPTLAAEAGADESPEPGASLRERPAAHRLPVPHVVLDNSPDCAPRAPATTDTRSGFRANDDEAQPQPESAPERICAPAPTPPARRLREPRGPRRTRLS